MEKGDLFSLVPLSIDREQKYISYLFKNPIESYIIPSEYFHDYSCRVINEGIKEILDKGMKFEFDALYQYCKSKELKIEYSYLTSLNSSYTDFDNIEFLRKEIREGFFTKKTLEGIEDFIVNSTKAKTIDKDILKESLNAIYKNLYDTASI